LDKNNLEKEIASYRCTMNRLSKGKSLTDPNVIRLRQGLDSLIHKYYFDSKMACTLHRSSRIYIERATIQCYEKIFTN